MKERPVRDTAWWILLNPKWHVCMVRNKLRGFPKGHTEAGENILDTAYREIREETGITDTKLQLIKELWTYTRPSMFRKEIKNITLFLFNTLDDFDKISPKKVKDNKILEIKWVPIEEVMDYLFHEQDKEFFLKHRDSIQEHHEKKYTAIDEISEHI